MTTNRLGTLLARHTAFWKRGSAAYPLVGKVPAPVWRRPYPLAGGGLAVEPQRIEPSEVDVELLLGEPPAPELTVGDLIKAVTVRYPAAWMEALIGCPIWVSAFGCVAKPAAADDLDALARDFSVEQALESPWMAIMDAALDGSAARAQGALPVRQLHLRGVIDMLAAYLGEERLCLALYESPEAVALLAEKFAALYIETARRGLRRRPLWHSGCVSLHMIYAPGPLVDYQIDASSLFSSEAYARHFLRHDRQVWSAFPYSVTHFHETGLHILDVVLKADELRAVQIQIDRETGRWPGAKARYLDSCRKTQAVGKGLIIHGELSDAEAGELLSQIEPEAAAMIHWEAAPKA